MLEIITLNIDMFFFINICFKKNNNKFRFDLSS